MEGLREGAGNREHQEGTVNHERLDRAQFAAEVRRKGTLLSDEAIGDVCEALLELLDGGSISLELHEELLGKARVERNHLLSEINNLKEQLASKKVDHTEMYAKAWERELGPPFVAKTHRIDSLVLTTRVRMEELRQLRDDLKDLMRYVDDAKGEAEKLGRITGEPLSDFMRRLRLEAARSALDEVIRNGERD